jgi:hypothetical protein
MAHFIADGSPTNLVKLTGGQTKTVDLGQMASGWRFCRQIPHSSNYPRCQQARGLTSVALAWRRLRAARADSGRS